MTDHDRQLLVAATARNLQRMRKVRVTAEQREELLRSVGDLRQKTDDFTTAAEEACRK